MPELDEIPAKLFSFLYADDRKVTPEVTPEVTGQVENYTRPFLMI